jgi:hypothetical protein
MLRGHDVVGGNIVVEVVPGDDEFTVLYGLVQSDTYPT